MNTPWPWAKHCLAGGRHCNMYPQHGWAHPCRAQPGLCSDMNCIRGLQRAPAEGSVQQYETVSQHVHLQSPVLHDAWTKRSEAPVMQQAHALMTLCNVLCELFAWHHHITHTKPYLPACPAKVPLCSPEPARRRHTRTTPGKQCKHAKQTDGFVRGQLCVRDGTLVVL
jgi:hypothetical protein